LRLKDEGKPDKLLVLATVWRLITIANAVLKRGTPWQHQPVT
jgi:transposase